MSSCPNFRHARCLTALTDWSQQPNSWETERERESEHLIFYSMRKTVLSVVRVLCLVSGCCFYTFCNVTSRNACIRNPLHIESNLVVFPDQGWIGLYSNNPIKILCVHMIFSFLKILCKIENFKCFFSRNTSSVLAWCAMADKGCVSSS